MVQGDADASFSQNIIDLHLVKEQDMKLQIKLESN